jgi:hypothetical protein
MIRHYGQSAFAKNRLKRKSRSTLNRTPLSAVRFNKPINAFYDRLLSSWQAQKGRPGGLHEKTAEPSQYPHEK